MATVSVIMPAYNVSPYIGDAIRSVQAQTETDWELLVVDDGSTDETPEIVRAMAAADPRVILLRQQNRGISAARNTALARARGAFIALLDSDDMWEPAYLASQLAIFQADPGADVVTGNGWLLGGARNGRPARPWPDSRPAPTLETMLADENAVFIMSVLRRTVYERVGGFDEALRTNEDYDYWLRAALHGFRFVRNDTPLGRYRRREDSASADDLRMLSGILLVFRKMQGLLAGREAELRIATAQIARFERERAAAAARHALLTGDVAGAGRHLAAVYQHGGGALFKLASYVAHWTPGLLYRAYQFRRARQGASL